MSAELPPSVAALLAEIETGQLSERARSTLARALRSAADGRAVAEILNADGRDRRDEALRALHAEHFAQMAPSAAAKGMAQYLARYAAGAWSTDAKGEPPRAGTLRRAAFDVLRVSEPPAWRTVLRALPRHPLPLANGSPPDSSMDDTP